MRNMSISIEGKTFKSITEACRHYKVNYEKVRNRIKCGWTLEEAFGIVERKKDETQEKIERVLKNTQITTSAFYKEIEKYGFILEEAYKEDDINREKIKYLISNISFLARSTKLSKQLSLLVKIINFARVCSRIKLSRGQTLKVLNTHYFDGIADDYIFVDFILFSYYSRENNIDIKELFVFVLTLFKDIITDDSLRISKVVESVLDSIDPLYMSTPQIVKHIEYFCFPDEMIQDINKVLDTVIIKFVKTYVTEIEPDILNIEDNLKWGE